MLSYILPGSGEKQQTVAVGGGGGGGSVGQQQQHSQRQNGRERLELSIHSDAVGDHMSLSKDISIGSFASDVTTATVSHSSMTSNSDKSKPKLQLNGNKHQSLKRVSFGSSKGSMVETLIFESPLQEEPEPSPIREYPNPFPEDQDQTEAEREKVRVKFFQQTRPQEVDLPEDSFIFDNNIEMATSVVTNTNHVTYERTESVESGWDNPFRPGGDLSREADEIVELIKGGKPITPTSTHPSDGHLANSTTISDHVDSNNTTAETVPSPQKVGQLQSGTAAAAAVLPAANPQQKSANGNVSKTGALDVKHGTVKPDGDASQVEHVTLKKKSKCECCVIQ